MYSSIGEHGSLGGSSRLLYTTDRITSLAGTKLHQIVLYIYCAKILLAQLLFCLISTNILYQKNVCKIFYFFRFIWKNFILRMCQICYKIKSEATLQNGNNNNNKNKKSVVFKGSVSRITRFHKSDFLTDKLAPLNYFHTGLRQQFFDATLLFWLTGTKQIYLLSLKEKIYFW